MDQPLTLIVGLLIVSVVLGILWFGWCLERGELNHDRALVKQQRQALDAEWQALDSARRVNDVFFLARRAMQAEARRHPRAPRR